MRLVTITLACDWANCDVTAPESEGLVTEMTLAVDGKAPKTFAICKNHRDDLEEDLHTLLARGVAVEPTKKKSPVTRSSAPVAGPTVPVSVEMTCRVPDCGQLCRGNVGLAQHLKKRHSLTIATYNELYPEPTE